MRLLALGLSATLLFALAGCDGEGSLPEEPQLFVDREELTFGQEFGSGTTVGTEAFESLYIENQGRQTLEITAMTKTGAPAFVVTLPAPLDRGQPLLLASGEHVIVQVGFRPQAAQAYTGSLVIESNAANAPSKTISLSGLGTTP